jgi:hypothetical protein
MSNNATMPIDPLFPRVEQAGPSVDEAHTQPSRHDHRKLGYSTASA